MMISAKLHDGSIIPIEIKGSGPNLLLPVNPHPIEGDQAEKMRKWGADPALGRNLIDGLSDKYRVIAFDYEGHVQAFPKAETLTPHNIATDFLTIADTTNAEQFVYYGYSWLALCGLQLAIRTSRLSALIMGGFPPIDGPYQEMLKVTNATYQMSVEAKPSSKKQQTTSEEIDWSTVEVTLSTEQTKQFVTLYQSLQDFHDREVQSRISIPRLCFAGTADKIEYGERWGGVEVDIVGPLMRNQGELEALGWAVHVLDGLDHTQAMQANHVLSVICPWLDTLFSK
ncbi:alpha/beta fold hydrolase [Shimazuella alba]|nr:alpha/beta fold hydrolase [Shimazuella alba]